MTLDTSKFTAAASAAICLMAISGCGEQSSAWAPTPGPIDCAVEVQIAVRSQPYSHGDAINDGDFDVLSTNVLPIKSDGGTGHIVSKNEKSVVELSWDAVKLTQKRKDQHHAPIFQIAFENCQFNIKNEIVRPDGTSHGLGTETATWVVTEDFDPKFSPITFTAADGTEQALVIRTRLLTQPTKAEPLDLADELKAATDVP